MKGVEYTSDRVAMVHARWRELKDGSEECTNCFGLCPHEENYNGDIIFNFGCEYCPWCGAKMDGERRDDEDCPSFVRAIPLTWIDKKITGYASQLKSHELDSLVTVKNMWERDLEE